MSWGLPVALTLGVTGPATRRQWCRGRRDRVHLGQAENKKGVKGEVLAIVRKHHVAVKLD